MNYRAFGTTGLKVSEIGFGAWGIGGPANAGSTPIGWSDWDPKTSKQAIERAVEVGIAFFDTADFYGFGKSEELLGEVLGTRWKEFVVATKVGHELASDGSIRLNYSRPYILKACEQSLKRLRKDSIDIYQLHSAKREHLEQGDCIEAMEELKRQGKIRFWGISLNTFEPEREGLWVLDHRVGDSFQLVLNIFNQKTLQELLPRAQKLGYGIIARMPLQFGLLTGKFTSETRFDAGDHRSMRLPPHLIEKGNELVRLFSPVAQNLGVTLGSLALKFVLAHEGVSTVIPGIKNPEQAEQNAQAADPPAITPHDLDLLHSLYESKFKHYLEDLRKSG
jgi:aryl-alcohol dehydrogenase-like predicted oxidoreductase